MGKNRNKKREYNLIKLGSWTSDVNIIDKYHTTAGKTFSYDNTLNELPKNNDLNVDIRLRDTRKAAEIHRQTRRYIQPLIKPGKTYLEICEQMESKIEELCGKNDLTAGIGFPIGFSVNHVAAHDSANPYDQRKIKPNDVIKVDFGTHVNGNIIDSAFTVAFNNRYDQLLQSTTDATWTGIKMAGPDAVINDISSEIKEVIESYEILINGSLTSLKSIVNLGGHNIVPYNIHGGKLILCGPSDYIKDMRMEGGEYYAIETFASTGNSMVREYNKNVNHYMLNNLSKLPILSNEAVKLYDYLMKTRSTLAFCNRWLIKDFGNSYEIPLQELVRNNVVKEYAPLVGDLGTYTSQLEHTIYLGDRGKEVLSVGDDY